MKQSQNQSSEELRSTSLPWMSLCGNDIWEKRLNNRMPFGPHDWPMFCQLQYSQPPTLKKNVFVERKIHENPTRRTVRLTFSIFPEIIRCFSVEVFPFSFEVLTAATCNKVYERLAKDGLQPSPVTPADFVKSCVPLFVCSLLLLLRWSVFSVLFCAFLINSVLHFRTHYLCTHTLLRSSSFSWAWLIPFVSLVCVFVLVRLCVSS